MICTFYSYKGGVGRSMAMANVADGCARRGLRVLMIDFDLEAPGLENYFQVEHAAVRRQRGLLDLLLVYKESMSVARDDEDVREPAFKNVKGFICPVYAQLPSGGLLDLMPAGQREDGRGLERYAVALRSFDWQDFYQQWEGEAFFDWLRSALVPKHYDIVLIDSRTGVTEMGGICAYQLADTVVMLCAANQQNVDGTRQMVRDFLSTTVQAVRPSRPLQIVVVPARVEQRSPELLEDFAKRFDEAFAEWVPTALREAGISFRDLAIPYEPEYSFKERIFSEPDRASDRQRVAEAFEQLTSAIAYLAPAGTPLAALAKNGASPLTSATTRSARPSPMREAASSDATSPAETPLVAPVGVTPSYDAAKRYATNDGVIIYDRNWSSEAMSLMEKLRARQLHLADCPLETVFSPDGKARLEGELFHSHHAIVCTAGRGLGDSQLEGLMHAVRRAQESRELRVIRVLLPDALGFDDKLAFPPVVDRFDFSAGWDDARLEQLAHALSGRPTSEPALETLGSRNPYLGLRAFQEHEAVVFFGRAKLIKQVLERLQKERLIVLLGAAGSGKSSLIRAGLMPALRTQPSARWKVCGVLLPGAEPLQALERAREEIAEAMSLSSAGEEDCPEAPRYCLFVDQLEDIFRHDRETQGKFLQALAELAQPSEGAVVVGLRADLYGPLLDYPEFEEQAAVVPVGQLEGEDLVAAIEQPARNAGLAFEPGLVARIHAEVANQPGALPLLQFLLSELWEGRREGFLTNEGYDRLGGIRGAVAAHAELAYQSLSAGAETIARRILLRLVKVEDRVVLRRVAHYEDLLGAGGDEARELVDRFVEERLLVIDQEKGSRTVEFAHEAIINSWNRLQKWVDEERTLLAARARLTRRAAEWQEQERGSESLLTGAALGEAQDLLNQQPEDLNASERSLVEASVRHQVETQRRQLEEMRRAKLMALRMRVLAIIASVAALLAIGTGVIALKQRNLAVIQREELMEQNKQIQFVTNAQLEGARTELNAAKNENVDQRLQIKTLEGQLAQSQQEIVAKDAILAALESKGNDVQEAERARRKTIAVKYYKWPDSAESVTNVVTGLDFQFEAMDPSGVGTNILLYGDVDLETVRLLAEKLISSGVGLRTITRLQPENADKKMIIISGYLTSQDQPLLTVEDVRKFQGAAGIATDLLPNVEVVPRNGALVTFLMAVDQIPKARDAIAAFKELEYPIPAPQPYWSRAYIPETTEVRYFRFPKDKAQADFIASMLRSFDPTVRSSYVISREEAKSSSPIFQVWFDRSAFTRPADRPALARIYLEASDDALDRAKKIKSQLEQLGYWVRIKDQTTIAADRSQVAYYSQFPDDAIEARNLVKTLKDLNIADVQDEPVSTEGPASARSRHFEIRVR